MRDDIQNVYENFSSIKAPPPVLASLWNVINELYLVTQIDIVEYQGDHIEEYPDGDAVDFIHEQLDDVLTQEHYEQLTAEFYLNREKNEI
jgi:hypothetical protein